MRGGPPGAERGMKRIRPEFPTSHALAHRKEKLRAGNVRFQASGTADIVVWDKVRNDLAESYKYVGVRV